MTPSVPINPNSVFVFMLVKGLFLLFPNVHEVLLSKEKKCIFFLPVGKDFKGIFLFQGKLCYLDKINKVVLLLCVD